MKRIIILASATLLFAFGAAACSPDEEKSAVGTGAQASPEASIAEAEPSVSAAVSEQPSATHNNSSNGDDNMNDQTENETTVKLSVNGKDFTVILEDNDTAKEFAQMFADAPLTIEMTDYSGFEKVGSLGRELAADNVNMTAQPGDIVLYNGSDIVIFYGSNTWDYTKIGAAENLDGWKDALGEGDVTAVFG